MLIQIGKISFDTAKKTFIMGILNVTPDSFHDGNKFNRIDKALKQAEKLIKEGADLIDIGAESTRPNHSHISYDEELKRLDNLVFELKKRFETPISVDTTKPKIAKFVLQQGSDLINDVSGLANLELANITANFNAAYCLMHNKKTVNPENFLNELTTELKLKLKLATSCGINPSKIIIDPGIGFNKTFIENILIIKHIPELLKLKFPVLIGASNKSFIGTILEETDTKLRANGTVAVTTIASMLGVNFIRVHDVKSNAQAIKIAEAIKNLE